MKKKRGITLIEVLISSVLLVTISAAVSTIYVNGYRTYREQFAEAQVNINAQTILDSIISDAKNAQSVEETYDIYTSGNNAVVLKVPAIDSNKNILYDGTSMLFDRIIYYFEGNAIHKKVFADASSARYTQNGLDKVLDQNILVLEFAYEPDVISTTLLTVELSASLKVGGSTRDISLIGKARLRNHL